MRLPSLGEDVSYLRVLGGSVTVGANTRPLGKTENTRQTREGGSTEPVWPQGLCPPRHPPPHGVLKLATCRVAPCYLLRLDSEWPKSHTPVQPMSALMFRTRTIPAAGSSLALLGASPTMGTGSEGGAGRLHVGHWLLFLEDPGSIPPHPRTDIYASKTQMQMK